MSTGQYLVTFILLSIPLLNFLLLLIWSFSGGTNANKQNLCRAILVMMVISVVLSIGILFAVYAGFASVPGVRPGM